LNASSRGRDLLNRLGVAVALFVLAILGASGAVIPAAAVERAPAAIAREGIPAAIARDRPVTTSGHPLTAANVILDVSPATRVLSLWKRGGRTGSGDGRTRADARRIGQTLPYRTVRVFLREQFRCIPTEEEVARAIELPDSGICGFGMDPAYRNRDSIAAVVMAVSARRAALGSQIAGDVSRYLPGARSWKKIRVWFVISSQTMFDAVSLRASADGDSVPVILINLTDVLSYGDTTRERLEALEHVLAHEVFHAGLRQAEAPLPGWADYRDASLSDFAYIRRVMVDEGLAHYIDWRERPGSDSLFTWKPSSRETFAFSQLAAACRRLRQPGAARGDLIEIIQLAGTGPLWSKYGAISGMFAAHRIEMALGRRVLRRAIEAGPDEFLRTYRQVARQNPRLSGIPTELMTQQ